MQSRTLTSIIAMTLFAALAMPIYLAAQPPQYTVIDLGTLGGTFSFAGVVNNHAWVSGSSTLPDDTAVHAFFWKSGTMSNLPTLGGPNGFAREINNRGEVAGFAENTTHDPTCTPPSEVQFKPVLWDNGGQ